MKTPVIEVEQLAKQFLLGEVTVDAVRGISFDIFSGTYNMLLGPSGCGKSTVLSLLAGLDIPTSGRILLRGEDIAKLSVDELAYHRRKRIGMVFQQFNLLRSLVVWENVALSYIFDGQPLERRRKRAIELLKLVRMDKFAERLPTQLSGGQQQKVAIVRALMSNPWILLVDEPTGNLDSVSAGEVMDFLQVLNSKSKRTLLLVTHNYEYVHYAERILYMRDGKLLTPDEASQAPGSAVLGKLEDMAKKELAQKENRKVHVSNASGEREIHERTKRTFHRSAKPTLKPEVAEEHAKIEAEHLTEEALEKL